MVYGRGLLFADSANVAVGGIPVGSVCQFTDNNVIVSAVTTASVPLTQT